MHLRQAFIAVFTLACCALLAAPFATRLVAQEQSAKPQSVYAGTWLDKEKTGLKMVISEDNGLLRITGGLEEYSYSLACIVKSGKAACVGAGGKLEGENFLYESVIHFAKDGSAAETWKAYNNLQAIDGKTSWVRQ